jgi:lipopolysaccharide/colanic/teichoic acid biosynthesis glycosyltransferase
VTQQLEKLEAAVLADLPAGPRPVYELSAAPSPHPLYNALKRVVDLTIGLPLAVLVLPVILVAAVAFYCETRVNPFFIQRRVGLLGVEFPMVKLRTMRRGSDDQVPRELDLTGGPTFKARTDPRVTRVGRLLRKTSIDELPQLFNVVAGHMSLVGPRPALMREVLLYRPAQAQRLRVKPGLTCIWQISGRSNVPFRNWMAMDRLYVGRRSFWFDLWILSRTPGAVLSMRGAL